MKRLVDKVRSEVGQYDPVSLLVTVIVVIILIVLVLKVIDHV